MCRGWICFYEQLIGKKKRCMIMRMDVAYFLSFKMTILNLVGKVIKLHNKYHPPLIFKY